MPHRSSHLNTNEFIGIVMIKPSKTLLINSHDKSFTFTTINHSV
jgi:hypothetical protein